MEIKNEVLVDLLDAAMAADYTRVKRLGSEIARLLAENDQPEAARKVRALMRKRGIPLQASGFAEALPVDASSRLPLVEEQDWPVTPLFVNEQTQGVLQRFLDDAQHVDLLSDKGLSPRLSLLLSGPPGTGKSLLAGHVASRLGKPLFVARLDSLISSRLGETAKNIRGAFEYVPSRGAVLFLDELDAIAKLRDDRHELGELKRVVNTVIQGLDSLDSHSVVIAATNHAHLLDSAIWRRFPYKIEMNFPDADVRTSMWLHFLYEDDPERDHEAQILSRISEGISGADIENLAFTVRRQSLLQDTPLNLATLAWAVYASRKGPLYLPPKNLDADQKRELAGYLAEQSEIKKMDIAEIVGVSRQMVARYLKEASDG